MLNKKIIWDFANVTACWCGKCHKHRKLEEPNINKRDAKDSSID